MLSKVDYSYTERFEMWFARPFRALREGNEYWNGAYIALSMGVFLCERYFRVETHSCEPLSASKQREIGRPGYDQEFKDSAATFLGLSRPDFDSFWKMYRHGIQHQGMPQSFFKKDGSGEIIYTMKHQISSDFLATPVFRHYGKVIVIELDPWKFTESMIKLFIDNPLYLEVGFHHAFSEVFSNSQS